MGGGGGGALEPPAGTLWGFNVRDGRDGGGEKWSVEGKGEGEGRGRI